MGYQEERDRHPPGAAMTTQLAKKTRPFIAQVCALVATLITVAPAAAGQDSRPASVHLAIDQPGALRDWQIESAVDQVRLIWGAAGIAVNSGRYGSPSKPDDARVSVRVLSIPARYLSNGAAVMGWVARDEDGRLTPAIFISLAGISNVLSQVRFAGTKFGELPTRVSDLIVAQTAGRVAAHELGHYLLQLTGHPRNGLMRREFLPRDLVDASPGPFLLTATESVLLRREVMTLARAQVSTQ
jgi:hypothetical protein